MRKDLIQTIRRVHAGQRHVPAEIAEELTEHFAADDLSPREVEVLQSIAGGRSNKIVADQLNISEDTVKGHMRNILAKLGANDRLDAVLIALKRGSSKVEHLIPQRKLLGSHGGTNDPPTVRILRVGIREMWRGRRGSNRPPLP
jgi:DNA-binding CsgD family transcriptional regulator